jgi:hypothetical protein
VFHSGFFRSQLRGVAGSRESAPIAWRPFLRRQSFIVKFFFGSRSKFALDSRIENYIALASVVSFANHFVREPLLISRLWLQELCSKSFMFLQDPPQIKELLRAGTEWL